MAPRGFYTLCLVLMGVGWGATIPLTKVAVSEGYQEFGLIFWQQIICAFVLGVVLCIRRQRLGFGRPQIVAYIMIAVFGTVLPNTRHPMRRRCICRGGLGYFNFDRANVRVSNRPAAWN